MRHFTSGSLSGLLYSSKIFVILVIAILQHLLPEFYFLLVCLWFPSCPLLSFLSEKTVCLFFFLYPGILWGRKFILNLFPRAEKSNSNDVNDWNTGKILNFWTNNSSGGDFFESLDDSSDGCFGFATCSNSPFLSFSSCLSLLFFLFYLRIFISLQVSLFSSLLFTSLLSLLLLSCLCVLVGWLVVWRCRCRVVVVVVVCCGGCGCGCGRGVCACGVACVACGVCGVARASVCTFKTSPCVPATSPHVQTHVDVLSAYTGTFRIHTHGKRFESTHGGHRQFCLPRTAHVGLSLGPTGSPKATTVTHVQV